MKRIIRTLLGERGAETLEWILIGALLVGVGVAVYNTTLKTQLNLAVTAVVTKLNAVVNQ